MRLNLREIIHVPGAVLPFDFQMDLSDLEWSGEHYAPNPVHVTGLVRNMAGALVLECEASTKLALTCDRCLKPFTGEKTVILDTLLATELAGEESDTIILLEKDELPLGDLVRETFILEMDTKHLCSEECKGLCAKCGADLNDGPCNCKPDIDPRLAALAQLLDDKKPEN
ncbi:conserved hypothetical protein [uncultured Eubacteriales bacterium]|uniref:DUF177 domain-containing protein n=1 Tax=uncultured Eubacteriales bacterium TaxID=172733 RepID=A0A212K1D9_9FIRM|nr:conserved hypothetical protein [uncultured Eubacteriales bacterium]